MINLKKEIEKDNANIHVKNIISLRNKNTNEISKIILFGETLDSKTYCVSFAEINKTTQKWELRSFCTFKDFSHAIREFARLKKENN